MDKKERDVNTNCLPISTPLSWAEWLQEFGPKFLLFARQQTRSLADAEDILQEALIKLAKKVANESFVGGMESWPSFIYTQIRREAIDLGRKKDRRSRREERVSEDEARLAPYHDEWLKSSVEGQETAAILEKALREVPEKFSEVIVMKVWGGQTFAEIGEALEVSLNTAASRYRYGLEALRKKLEEFKSRGDI